MPLLPMSGAKESTWEVRLGAAAEQTKEAPLGLHARDRILQHTWAGVRQSPAQGGRQALALSLILFQEMGRWAQERPGPTENLQQAQALTVRRKASGSPGHIIIDVDFTEVLLGFCVIKTHGSHTTAQQELEREGVGIGGQHGSQGRPPEGAGPSCEALD